jgi:hypothetical protein
MLPIVSTGSGEDLEVVYFSSTWPDNVWHLFVVRSETYYTGGRAKGRDANRIQTRFECHSLSRSRGRGQEMVLSLTSKRPA